MKCAVPLLGGYLTADFPGTMCRVGIQNTCPSKTSKGGAPRVWLVMDKTKNKGGAPGFGATNVLAKSGPALSVAGRETVGLPRRKGGQAQGKSCVRRRKSLRLRSPTSTVFSNSGAPSVDGEFCAVNETRPIRRQEDNGLGNFVRCGRTARRGLCG